MFVTRRPAIIITILACFLQAQGADKYTDENRPYEFGFTIDGEQHRHEKKDERGLIMGEFGFITADGVYHVTVYATDENGNFKILSMKNLRVKPYPTAPERKGNSLPFPPVNNPSQSLAPPVPQKPISIGPPAQSCSHCSIPTTSTQPPPQYPQPSYPEQNYPIQNYPQQNYPSQNYPKQNYPQQSYPVQNNPQQTYPRQDNSQQSYPGQGNLKQSYPGQGNPEQSYPDQGKTYPGQDNSQQSYPGQGNLQQSYPTQGNPEQSYPGQGNPQQSSQGSPQQNYPGQGNPQQSYPGQGNPQKSYPADGANYPQQAGEREPKQFEVNKPQLIYAQMSLADKNTDINRKGPGEKEGLPNGLTKDNMHTLLYTFNYTVGFHGHHEEGYSDGAKKGYYYITGRNGIKTRVDYEADEKGFRPKITQEVLDLISEDVPKEETEKDAKYGLKGYEFKWLYYPSESSRSR